MNIKNLLFFSICAFSLAGCVSVPLPADKSPYKKEIDNDYNDVWTAAISTLTDLNLNIDNVAKESGLISLSNNLPVNHSRQNRLFHDYAYCSPDSSFFSNHRLKARNSIFLRKVDDKKTSLKIVSSYEAVAKNNWDNTDFKIDCVSSGEFEKNIYEGILLKIKPIKTE